MRRPPAFRTLIILGVLGIIGGLILGVTSHGVTYQSVGQSTIAHFLSSSDSNTGYFQMDGSSTLYIINENDFTPVINGTQTFANGDVISFVYQPDDTTDIDITSNLGTHLQGTAYRIVQITAADGNGNQQVYTTSAYSQHPQGYYQNNWLSGIGIAIVGLLLFIGAFFVKSKPQPGFSISPAGAMGGMPPANPYQQPYPNSGPYQQPPNPYAQSPYQQPPDPYAQPPYQQPPYQPPPNPYNNYPPQNQ